MTDKIISLGNDEASGLPDIRILTRAPLEYWGNVSCAVSVGDRMRVPATY